MAFTYLIGWSRSDKWYYGVRYAKGCAPSDLWRTYFTSSRHVEKTRSLLGEPDVVEVRRVFDDPMKAREWEDKVLRRLAVPCSEKWLNRHHGGKYFGSQPKTAETRRKMSESRKALGIKMSEETKERIRRAALARPPRKMGPMSEDTKRKISEANRGKPGMVGDANPTKRPEVAAKISASKTGVSNGPHTEETRRKISEANKGRPGKWGDDNPSRRDDVRAKISQALTGRVRSDAEREAIRKSCVGRVMPKRGPMSEETKQKIRAARLARKLGKE